MWGDIGLQQLGFPGKTGHGWNLKVKILKVSFEQANCIFFIPKPSIHNSVFCLDSILEYCRRSNLLFFRFSSTVILVVGLQCGVSGDLGVKFSAEGWHHAGRPEQLPLRLVGGAEILAHLLGWWMVNRKSTAGNSHGAWMMRTRLLMYDL